MNTANVSFSLKYIILIKIKHVPFYLMRSPLKVLQGMRKVGTKNKLINYKSALLIEVFSTNQLHKVLKRNFKVEATNKVSVLLHLSLLST